MNPPYLLSFLQPALPLRCSGPTQYQNPRLRAPCLCGDYLALCWLLFNTSTPYLLVKQILGFMRAGKTASWHRQPDIGAGQWLVNIYLSKRKWKLFPDWIQHSSTLQSENQGEMSTVAAVTTMIFFVVVGIFDTGSHSVAQASLKFTL